MAKVTILGKDFEFFWSTQAVSDVSEQCGGLEKLYDWINGDDVDTATTLKRFTYVFETLVNAAIKRDNYAIKHGFIQGEPKEEFVAGELAELIGLKDMKEMTLAMFEALNININTIEVPDGAKIEQKEIDETLEEIKDARAKKEESGDRTGFSA